MTICELRNSDRETWCLTGTNCRSRTSCSATPARFIGGRGGAMGVGKQADGCCDAGHHFHSGPCRVWIRR